MKTYSVKEIADMLSVDQETVRRWIRDKKLKADTPSRKEGSQVKEEDLYKYLSSTAKYAGKAAVMAAESPALAVLPLIGAGTAGVMSALMAVYLNEKKKNPQLSEESVKSVLDQGIIECKDSIQQKLRARDQLDEEIAKLQTQLEAYQELMKKLQKSEEETTDGE